MTHTKTKNRFIIYFIFSLLITLLAVSYFYVEEKRQMHFTNLIKYHKKMIKSGSISSLVSLGKMYESGEGVEKDLSKAQELFKKAINYNKYLDEIYPSYSDYDTEDNNDEYSNIDNPEFNQNKKTNSKLNKIITSIDNNEIEIKKSNKPATNRYDNKPKYVPYAKKIKKPVTYTQKKSTLTNVVIFPKTIPSSKTTNSISQKTTNSKTRKSSNVVKKPSQVKNSKKRLTRKASKRKSSTKTASIQKKSISNNKKIRSKSNSYKKNAVITKKKPIRKTKMQAILSPTLYEQRNDYESEYSIFADDEQFDEDDEEVVKVKENKKETVGTNFTSNPCTTASARYIAKCRRINKGK